MSSASTASTGRWRSRTCGGEGSRGCPSPRGRRRSPSWCKRPGAGCGRAGARRPRGARRPPLRHAAGPGGAAVVTLRAQFRASPRTRKLLVFTTQGYRYVGTLIDIEDEAVRLARADSTSPIALSLNDVSGVRPFVEETEVELRDRKPPPGSPRAARPALLRQVPRVCGRRLRPRAPGPAPRTCPACSARRRPPDGRCRRRRTRDRIKGSSPCPTSAPASGSSSRRATCRSRSGAGSGGARRPTATSARPTARLATGAGGGSGIADAGDAAARVPARRPSPGCASSSRPAAIASSSTTGPSTSASRSTTARATGSS